MNLSLSCSPSAKVSCVLSSLLNVGGTKTIAIGKFKSKLYKNILSGMYILLLRT